MIEGLNLLAVTCISAPIDVVSLAIGAPDLYTSILDPTLLRTAAGGIQGKFNTVFQPLIERFLETPVTIGDHGRGITTALRVRFNKAAKDYRGLISTIGTQLRLSIPVSGSTSSTVGYYIKANSPALYAVLQGIVLLSNWVSAVAPAAALTNAEIWDSWVDTYKADQLNGANLLHLTPSGDGSTITPLTWVTARAFTEALRSTPPNESPFPSDLANIILGTGIAWEGTVTAGIFPPAVLRNALALAASANAALTAVYGLGGTIPNGQQLEMMRDLTASRLSPNASIDELVNPFSPICSGVLALSRMPTGLTGDEKRAYLDSVQASFQNVPFVEELANTIRAKITAGTTPSLTGSEVLMAYQAALEKVSRVTPAIWSEAVDTLIEGLTTGPTSSFHAMLTHVI
jgi:hypothetical protein